MMETYVSLLQTYGGRDKILRTASYVASLLSGSVKNEETANKLVTVSRQLSNSRVVLRFFDDILMWRITSHWSAEVRLSQLRLSLQLNILFRKGSHTYIQIYIAPKIARTNLRRFCILKEKSTD